MAMQVLYFTHVAAYLQRPGCSFLILELIKFIIEVNKFNLPKNLFILI